MSLQKLISNYATCNAWSNKSILEWLHTKPVEKLYETVPSSFPSIVKTLNHILAVEEFWHCVVAEIEIKGGRYATTTYDHEEIMMNLALRSTQIAEFVSGLSESDLEKEIFIDMPWVKGQLPRYEFIQHVINHTTYHRGQIITIGRNLGFTDAPMTDYNFYNMMVLKRG